MQPASAPAPATDAVTERILWGLLLTLSAAAAVLLVALVAQRVGHPYELEWMEGAMVDHAARVRHGLDVYTAPSVEHVAYLYTPLLYYLGALAMTVVGETYLAMRLVGIGGSLLTMAAMWLLVRHATGQRRPALVAVGLFCAGYGVMRTWYDIGRCDCLFMGWFLAAACLLRCGRTTSTAVLAGPVWTLAFLSKQVAMFWLPLLAVMALIQCRRRGLVFCVSAGTCFLVTLASYHVATDGWFTFFVLTMPRRTGSTPAHWLGYWTNDLVPTLPLLATAALAVSGRITAGQRRDGLALGAFVLGGLLTSYASRVHAGGFDNALMYGFVALCCAGPMAVTALARLPLRRTATALLAVQFLFLVVDVRALYAPTPPLLYDPRLFLPRPQQQAATEQLIAWMRDQPGEVWSVFHGHIATLAGKHAHAHALAMGDMMHYSRHSPADDPAVVAMRESIHRALREGGLAAVQLEQPLGIRFEEYFADYLHDFERVEIPLVAGPDALCSVIGMPTFLPYALVPKR